MPALEGMGEAAALWGKTHVVEKGRLLYRKETHTSRMGPGRVG
jgi:hypothetical protein